MEIQDTSARQFDFFFANWLSTWLGQRLVSGHGDVLEVDPFIGVYIYGIPSASAPKILEPGATGSLEGCARFDLDTMYHVSLRKQCTR